MVLCTMIFLFQPGPLRASDARLSLVPQSPETPGNIALVIDHAEKIAGLKITFSYDKDLVSFVKASKAKATSSFMHVVNDKQPGKIIIVMASAKGVSGDNLTLAYLEFKLPETLTDKVRAISVIQVQLMDENLKEIKGNNPEYRF